MKKDHCQLIICPFNLEHPTTRCQCEALSAPVKHQLSLNRKLAAGSSFQGRRAGVAAVWRTNSSAGASADGRLLILSADSEEGLLYNCISSSWMKDRLSSKDFTICIILLQHFSLLARQCVVKLWQKLFVKKKKMNTATYRCSFLPFVHSISSDVGGGHGVAAPHKTHRHQSAESLPDLIGITCRWAHTHTKWQRGLEPCGPPGGWCITESTAQIFSHVAAKKNSLRCYFTKTFRLTKKEK